MLLLLPRLKRPRDHLLRRFNVYSQLGVNEERRALDLAPALSGEAQQATGTDGSEHVVRHVA